MNEGEEADRVFYIVSGQCRVVKDLHKPGERTLNVLTRGTCMGDWGVVNGLQRTASCLAVGDVQLLVIHAFNFKACACQSLLDALSDNATTRTAEAKVEAQTVGAVRSNAVATIREGEDENEEKENQSSGSRVQGSRMMVQD